LPPRPNRAQAARHQRHIPRSPRPGSRSGVSTRRRKVATRDFVLATAARISRRLLHCLDRPHMKLTACARGCAPARLPGVAAPRRGDRPGRQADLAVDRGTVVGLYHPDRSQASLVSPSKPADLPARAHRVGVRCVSRGGRRRGAVVPGAVSQVGVVGARSARATIGALGAGGRLGRDRHRRGRPGLRPAVTAGAGVTGPGSAAGLDGNMLKYHRALAPRGRPAARFAAPDQGGAPGGGA